MAVEAPRARLTFLPNRKELSMSAPAFSILLDGKDLTFTARHSITLSLPEKGLVVEPFHEHQFRVTAQIRGALNDEGLLIDFHAAHAILKEILNDCHRKVFLAENQKGVEMTRESNRVRAEFTATDPHTGIETGERLTVPAEQAVLLPGVNASAELIALHIASRYDEKLKAAGLIPAGAQEPLLTLTLEENPGMKAVVTL